MDYITYFEKMNYLLELVQKGRLTSLKQAAEKFECSKSIIKRILTILCNKGHHKNTVKKIKNFMLKFEERSKFDLSSMYF